MVAGMMPMPPHAGAPPMWTGYIGVDDVDAYAERVKVAGGAIHRAPEDIPGIGRFSVVADPHGASFILFKANSEPQTPPNGPTDPGRIGWSELYAGDLDAAFAFYSGLFGWTKVHAMDMGPMGIYQTFAIDGEQAGGMMKKLPQMPAPFWLYYFNVDSLDAAVDRVTGGGGKILKDAAEVPGPLWIAQCLDPQGAMFALVAPKR
jgi:predicted enzyme related to lactoylglutathione lyase